jgi:hypothetical protein
VKERKRPKFPAKFFPSRASGRVVSTWRELMAEAKEDGSGWLEDADGNNWTVGAVYVVSRVKSRRQYA